MKKQPCPQFVALSLFLASGTLPATAQMGAQGRLPTRIGSGISSPFGPIFGAPTLNEAAFPIALTPGIGLNSSLAAPTAAPLALTVVTQQAAAPVHAGASARALDTLLDRPAASVSFDGADKKSGMDMGGGQDAAANGKVGLVVKLSQLQGPGSLLEQVKSLAQTLGYSIEPNSHILLQYGPSIAIPIQDLDGRVTIANQVQRWVAASGYGVSFRESLVDNATISLTLSVPQGQEANTAAAIKRQSPNIEAMVMRDYATGALLSSGDQKIKNEKPTPASNQAAKRPMELKAAIEFFAKLWGHEPQHLSPEILGLIEAERIVTQLENKESVKPEEITKAKHNVWGFLYQTAEPQLGTTIKEAVSNVSQRPRLPGHFGVEGAINRARQHLDGIDRSSLSRELSDSAPKARELLRYFETVLTVAGRPAAAVSDTKKITLSKKWVDEITQWPESGMGYHLVNIQLKDKTTYGPLVVLNADEMIVPTVIPDFKEEDIVSISNHSKPAPSAPALTPSEWKHLSKQSVDALRALRAGGRMSGYKLMSETGLNAGLLSQALREISEYPLIRLTTIAGSTTKDAVGSAMIVLLPSAVGTVDLFLNKTWSRMSKPSLAVLRAVRERGAVDGYRLMHMTRFDESQLSAALTEIVEGPFPLITLEGTAYGPGVVNSMASVLPSTARFIDALLAYRR